MLRSIALALSLMAAPLLTPAAQAQDYPTKPVRLVVPFAPGGVNDYMARLFATSLAERMGQQFVVENRAGGGGVVASEFVAKAAPDGYTLLILSLAHAVNPWLYKLPYDARKAFTPVAIFASSPNMLAVNANLPAKDLKEFIALAKAKPGELQYASGGIGGSPHLGFELFKLVAGINLTHVPFRGAGPGVIDVMGGHTSAIVATVTTLSPHVRSGKLRALGLSGTKRNPVMPEVPTMDEQGVKGYEAGNWVGLAGPAGMPPAIVERLNKEVAAIQQLPDIKQKLANDGADSVTMTPAEITAYLDSEIEKWGKVIKAGNIKAE